MSINSIYNYLKRIEHTLTSQEPTEFQFLNISLYANSNFDLKNFSLSIFDKLKDTTYLLNQLKLTIEKTKNEIVEQINSNYSNYVILISKLQTIDFLVDNITEALNNIKSKINNQLSLVGKYKHELEDMLQFITNNDNEIQRVNQIIQTINNKMQCERIIEDIDKYIKENDGSIKDENYTSIRNLLFKIYKMFYIKDKGVNIEIFEMNNKKEDNNIIIDEQHQQTKNVIDIATIKYNQLINTILDKTIKKYMNDNNNIIHVKLNSTLLNLIAKIFTIQHNEKLLYNFIYTSFIKTDLNNVLAFNPSANSIQQILKNIINLIESDKYQNLISSIGNNQNNNKFIFTCFIKPFIDSFKESKMLFNCTDAIQFKNNYIAIIEFLLLFTNNISKEQKNELKEFLHRFSFFIYFQYIQNDLSLTLIDMTSISSQNANEINIMIMVTSLRAFYSQVENMINNKTVFLKNLPNFLHFVMQCLVFIKDKNDIYLEHNELIRLYNDDNTKDDIDNNEKDKIKEYYNVVNSMKEYFNDKFENGLMEIIQRENQLIDTQINNIDMEKSIKEISEEIKNIVNSI